MRLYKASCSILKHKRWWWAGEIDSWSLNWWPSYYIVCLHFYPLCKDHQNIWLLPQEIALHFLFKDHDSSISLHLDGSKPVRSAYFYSLGRENSQGYYTLDLHYHLEVQANSKKNARKKPMLFLASMGETGLSHDIFFNSHLGLSRSLRLNENRGWIFEAATSNFCNNSWNFASSPRNGKVDLCTT